MTCAQNHTEISYQGGKCPLCQGMREIRELRQLFENMQFNLLVTEGDILSEFCCEEKSIFTIRGRA